MPEANVLYFVTAVVVGCLVVWAVVVLRTAKEPWARAAPAGTDGEGELGADSTEIAAAAEVAGRDMAKVDADSTAKATPMALAGDAKTGEGESGGG